MQLRTENLRKAALLLGAVLCISPSFAQNRDGNASKKAVTKDETVVLRDNNKGGRTIIEIKNGTVYVNGEAIVTVHDQEAANVRKKVIIEHGDGGAGDGGGFQTYSYKSDEDNDFRDMPAPKGRRAMLGVMTDPKAAKVGALIRDVNPGSPAEDAGLKAGDVITRVDGKAIKDAAALVAEISAQHEPGDKVTINYERNGKEMTTSATLERAAPEVSMRSFRMSPEDFGNGQDMPNFFRSFPFNAGDDPSPAPRLGVNAEDRPNGGGVKVMEVKPGSPAEEAGIKEGDVLTRLDEEQVASVDELQMLMRSHKPGDRLKLQYQRGTQTATAEVKLPKPVKRKDL